MHFLALFVEGLSPQYSKETRHDHGQRDSRLQGTGQSGAGAAFTRRAPASCSGARAIRGDHLGLCGLDDTVHLVH